MQRFRMVPLAASLSIAAAAQIPQLKVLSATVNLQSHNIAVRVENESSKVVTAYALAITQEDADGKPIKDASGNPSESVGVDLLEYDSQTAAWKEIQPGAVSSFPIGTGLLPDAASVEASVTGVVYSDRTFEGQAQNFFAGRANDAREARQALALLTPRPTTPAALESVLQKLRAMPHGIGLSVLANQVHITGVAAGALFDKKEPLPALAPPTAQQWDDIAAELSKRAAFWDAQSQAVPQ